MQKEFDYIIVGAGSAGCVLANRLSVDSGNQVLLIEAGEKDSFPMIHIPGGCGNLHRSKVDWGFETEPQENVLNRRIYLPRGKALGGCSSTNYMAYVRGNKTDYNHWATLGNEGWSYDEVLPYFKKSEDNQNIKNDFHQQGGPLNVEFSKSFKTPYVDAFIEGCKEVGFEANDDYNGATQEGVGFFQHTIKNGKRHSTAAAFLNPVKKRNNLVIKTATLVEKVIIEQGRAVGVQVKKNASERETLICRKEVIVSAGAFNSPQVLMLSGIGDKEELAQHGISCVQHLPGVGKNLQDHLILFVGATTNTQEGLNHYVKPLSGIGALAKYVLFKKGPLTLSPLEAVAFGKSSISKGEVDYQFHFAALNAGEDHENIDAYDAQTLPRVDGFSIIPTLLNSKSRGYVKLQSNKVEDKVSIQPNFLSEPEDLQILLEATKKAIEVIKSKAFAPHVKDYLYPTEETSDEKLIHHIKNILETVFHPVGTCKMGKDEMAVVDERLRVKGIQNLRVIDASIMPKIVSGNTNAPTIMIGEKGADMILEDQNINQKKSKEISSQTTIS